MRYLPTAFCNARRAAVAVQVALTMTVLMSMLAIVVDGGLLLAQRQQQQAAADAAAMAYATAMANGLGTTDAQASALAIAAANGAANDGTLSLITPNSSTTSGGVTTAVHGIWNGPITGPFVSKAGTTGYATGYVQVVLEYDEVRLFSAILGTGTLPVRAQAVAAWTAGTSTYWNGSILSLSISAGPDTIAGGNGAISVPGNIFSNDGIKTNGNGSITSTGGTIQYVGSKSGSGFSPTPTLAASTMNDPLANLAAPTPAQAGSTQTIGKSTTLNPGVYVGGISLSGGNYTLNPGIYYLQGGGLSLTGQASVTDNGAGVLIYNGPAADGSVGSISIAGQGSLIISPMTSGTWQGISIFQEQTSTASMSLEGNGTITINGMVYAPGSAAAIGGNGTMNGSTTFITSTLSVHGNGTFTTPTVQVPIPGSGTGGVQLVQ